MSERRPPAGGAAPPEPEETCSEIPKAHFSRRQESWIALRNGLFYKIFRRGGDPLVDWRDPECAKIIETERRYLCLLASLSPAVCEPVACCKGCMVLPALSGPDMLTSLRDRGDTDAPDCVNNAMRVLAELHAYVPDGARLPLRDYLADGFIPVSSSILARIDNESRVVVTGGFEVRNFRFDSRAEAWRFFDPHHVFLGVAEHDIGRFIISLLMINWGRDGRFPYIWNRFDIFALLAAYDAYAACPADPVLVGHFVRDAMAMRRHHADKAIGRMHASRRLIAKVYKSLYFRQMESWIQHHAL